MTLQPCLDCENCGVPVKIVQGRDYYLSEHCSSFRFPTEHCVSFIYAMVYDIILTTCNNVVDMAVWTTTEECAKGGYRL